MIHLKFQKVFYFTDRKKSEGKYKQVYIDVIIFVLLILFSVSSQQEESISK